MDDVTADLFNTDGQENISDEVMEQIQVMDQTIRACFNSRAGRKVLAHMREISSQPGFDAGMGLFNGIANGFAREGQTALVQYLEKRMHRAEIGKYER